MDKDIELIYLNIVINYLYDNFLYEGLSLTKDGMLDMAYEHADREIEGLRTAYE